MSQLQIRLFGGFQVHLNEQPIRFPTQKVRALFAYLSVEAQSAHPREKLMTLFWPEQSQNSASNNLRQTLSRLRAVLPADTLLIRDNEIQFNPQSEVNLDVARFLSLIETKSRHTQLVAFDDPGWLRQAEASASLYRGDFLAHFAVADCAEFEEWVLLKREWLRRCVNDLFFQCARVLAGLYNFDQALHYTWRQIELDTLNEEAHHQFIHILALAGRKSEAIAHYEYCRNLLKAELGVEPAQSTSALYERLLHNEIGTDAETRIGTGVQSLAPPVQATTQTSNQKQATNNFPAQLLPLIGREREVAACIELLSEPAVRLVTILGAGGMGKTHLAIEVGQQIINLQSQQFDATVKNSQLALHRPDANFTDGVYFVSLVALLSPDAIVATIAAAMDFTFRSEVDPLLQLQDYLRSRNVLLIVDNFEHLLAGAATLVDLLSAAPRVKALITSRAALNVAGEQLFPLDGLEYPRKTPLKEQSTSVNIESLSLYGAVRLFSQSARRLNPAFRLDDSNGEAIDTICRLVQGMPLSLLLSAAWIPLLTPAAIVEQLTPPLTPSGSSSLDFLESDWRGMNERQRSLRLVFERSWQLLTAELQFVFARLSVFRGGFRFETAQIITKISLRQLLVLVNHSLVRRADDGRYDLHELIRQYAKEKMELSTDNGTTRSNHADYFKELLLQNSQKFRRSGEAEAVTSLSSDAENIRVAWQWLLSKSNFPELDRMITPLALFYALSGRNLEGERVFQNAFDELNRKVQRIPDLALIQRLQAHTLLWLTDFQSGSVKAEEIDRMLVHAQQILANPVLAAEDSRRERAFMCLLRGWRSSQVDISAARRCFEESLSLYQELDDTPRVADSLNAIGSSYYAVFGATDLAERYVSECLGLRRELGDLRGIAFALDRMGLHAQDQGRLDDAEALRREALQYLEQVGNQSDIAVQAWMLGQTINLNGKFIESKTHLWRAVLLTQELGLRGLHALVFEEYNGNLVDSGEHQGVSTAMEGVIQTIEEIGNMAHLSLACTTMSLALLAEGKVEEAYKYSHHSIEYARGRFESGLALSLAYCAYIEYALGIIINAQTTVREALQIAKQINHRFDGWLALGAAALIFAQQDKILLAVELREIAWRFPRLRHWVWYKNITARVIDQPLADLPDKQVETAIMRGKTVDLWEAVDWVIEELQKEQ